MNKTNTHYQRLIGEGAPTDYFYGTYVDNVSLTQANVDDKPTTVADKSTNIADKPPDYQPKSRNTIRDERFASPESPESECCCLMSLFCCCTF